MGRILRSLFQCFCFAGCLLLAHGTTAASTELDALLRKIEARNYRWIAIRADVLVFFSGLGNSRAMCSGELLYQRLEERMILSCADTRKELVFLFRSFDRRFDLYLPAQKTVYHGTIFDMEDSPEIESHLKARDLYRALKPLAVDARRAKIERTNFAITNVDVYSDKNASGALVRKLYLTPEGDVLGELFYNTKKRPVLEIHRYDFREIPGQGGAFGSIIFPKKVTILSPEDGKGSAIFFTQVQSLDAIDPLEFILRVPPGTQEVFLEEKDPRFAIQNPEKRSEPVQAPRPEAPSSVRSPVKISKREPPPEPKKQPEAPPPAPQKTIEKKPEIQAPAVIPPPAPAKEELSINKDAAMAVEAPSPGPDTMTSLDPSLEPSLEMGDIPKSENTVKSGKA